MNKTYLIIFIAFAFTACTISTTKKGQKLNESVMSEFQFAKSALKLLEEGKKDSLKLIFNKAKYDNSPQEGLDLLFTNGEYFLTHNEKPFETMITFDQVSDHTNEITYTTFKFPYFHKNSSDSSVSFNVTVGNNEIYKLTYSKTIRSSTVKEIAP